MAFAPSPYQQRVFDWVEKGRGSAVVVAVAGSGKTTTVLNALPRIPESASVQLFAFNTAIARELKERVEAMKGANGRAFGRVRAGTFHSVCFSAVCKRLGKPSSQIVTDGGKMRKLCRDGMGEGEYELYADYVCKLVGLAKGEGIGCLVPDTDERWWAIIEHHDLYLDSLEANEARALELARAMLRRSNEAALEGHIDFDDMLYLPLLWRLRLWQNDWVFIDEAQDTNPVRRAIAKLALRPGGRLVAVGDPRQAIYGFTGASHDAIELIKTEFSAIELPLTVSYRCAKAVVAKAAALVPYLEAHADAPEGVVETLSTIDALKVLNANSAVLCRNTAPLIGLAYQLIAKGVGCAVLGREIGAGLTALIKKQRARGIDMLVAKLEAYRDREVAKWTAKGEERKAEAVSDRVACVFTVIENLPETERTVPALVGRIEGLFTDNANVLTLCTAHKAKGREWDTVAILAPELMPSSWARQEWQRVQEENLMYVAWTRAKRHLIFMQ